MNEQCCPIYKEAKEARPWQKPNSPNAGLLFDKFAHAWRKKQGAWEFDKAHGGQSWLQRFAKNAAGESKQLEEACQRQRDLVTALGGEILCVKNTSRFVTGMGREHPLENGFTWHHTLGAPYLPGSSLKGLLRAWLREEKGSWDPAANKDNGAWTEDETWAKRFGTQGAAGRFILLDMLPTKPPTLTADIMTPHYGPYYQEGKPPGDWHSPIPIQFLAVEQGASWQLGILPVPGKDALGKSELNQLKDALIEALDWLGAGAKTAVGYGRFEHDAKMEEGLREMAEQERRRQEEHRKREAALAKLSPELAELQRRAENEGWKSDKSRLLDGLQHYLAGAPEPTTECIKWIRDRMEENWQGIWDNPDKTKGKKQKPFYKERPKAIVHRLKRLTEEDEPQ